jgi:hypothetical protein
MISTLLKGQQVLRGSMILHHMPQIIRPTSHATIPEEEMGRANIPAAAIALDSETGNRIV